jgi:hypothetical protein
LVGKAKDFDPIFVPVLGGAHRAVDRNGRVGQFATLLCESCGLPGHKRKLGRALVGTFDDWDFGHRATEGQAQGQGDRGIASDLHVIS